MASPLSLPSSFNIVRFRCVNTFDHIQSTIQRSTAAQFTAMVWPCTRMLPGTHSLVNAYAGCVQACCYEHLCIRLLVHRWMNFYRVCVGKELWIYKIKSNCLPKRYWFTLPPTPYESPCSSMWSATLPLSNFKIFAHLVGVKMHCEV